MLILAKNFANIFVAAKKVPLIKDIEFAEREKKKNFYLRIFHQTPAVSNSSDNFCAIKRLKKIKPLKKFEQLLL